jgi:hypothetical protein
LDQHVSRSGTGSRVDEVLRDVEGKTSLDSRIKTLDDFLNRDTIPPLPENARPDRDRIENRRNSLRQERERQKWEDMLNIVRGTPERFSANRDVVRAYLRENRETAFRAEAEARICSIENSWDKSEYDRLYNLLEHYQKSHDNLIPTPSNVASLAKEMRAYRDRSDPAPQMKHNVDEWLQWYDRVSRSNTVCVLFEKSDIIRRSILDERWDSYILIRVRHSSLSRGLEDEREHKRTGDAVQRIKLNTQFDGIPHNPISNLAFEVVSRWGWTRGLPDRVLPVSVSIVTKEAPLMHDKERTGTLYIRVNEQPTLPPYTSNR